MRRETVHLRTVTCVLGLADVHVPGATEQMIGARGARGRGAFCQRVQRVTAGSAGLPVAVEDGGAQGRLGCAERRQDGRHGPIVHSGQGKREVLDADVVVVPHLGLAAGVLQALLGARGETGCARPEQDLRTGRWLAGLQRADHLARWRPPERVSRHLPGIDGIPPGALGVAGSRACADDSPSNRNGAGGIDQ